MNEGTVLRGGGGGGGSGLQPGRGEGTLQSANACCSAAASRRSASTTTTILCSPTFERLSFNASSSRRAPSSVSFVAFVVAAWLARCARRACTYYVRE